MTRLARQELKSARSAPENDDTPKGQFY
jgi:hypothetical protein